MASDVPLVFFLLCCYYDRYCIIFAVITYVVTHIYGRITQQCVIENNRSKRGCSHELLSAVILLLSRVSVQ